MINNVQNTFSIQDLELLSGIKAHTIRIWEKRFEIFNPSRLGRNIRKYGILDLQKILNISLLQQHGYKISDLAKRSDEELENTAKSVSLDTFSSNYNINALLVSMFSYNADLFEEIYSTQIKTLSFKEIFVNSFIPLLNHIGILWQTKRVNPSQEHFISNLIYQKILLNIAILPKSKIEYKHVNILYLPEGEVHEIGLLFMVYHLKSIGERTIYLGRDIPVDDLVAINGQFEQINWICAFMIDRTDQEKKVIYTQIVDLLKNTNNTFKVVGKIWSNYALENSCKNITFYEGFEHLI